jgi:uncharacterized protein (DUF1501 family)
LDEDKKTAGATASLLVGGGPPPVALRGRRSVASAIERLDDFTLAGGADPRKRGEWLQEDTKPKRQRGEPSLTLRVSVEPHATAADDLTAFVRRSMLDAYATADRLTAVAAAADTSARYPDSGLGQRLQMIARLLKAGFGTRVYYTLQGGYDTHNAQLQTHSQLLSELAGALKALLDDLAAAKLTERVAVLMFSEFGRTVSENASAGTDHGTSGPVLLAGPGLKAALVGETPSLIDLDPKHGDLRVRTDFRQVYASILEDWLGVPGRAALGGDFAKLTLFR